MTTRREILFATDRLVVGSFRCDVSDPRWDRENSIDDGFNIVFPSAPVRITRSGGPAVLADRNQVMLYDHGDRYRREAGSRDGDACTFVLVEERLLQAVASAAGLPHRDTGFGFPLQAVPSSVHVYLMSRMITHRLRAGVLDRREAEHHLVDLVTEVVDGLARVFELQDRGEVGASAAHAALAEGAKSMLGEFPPAPPVAEVAARLGVSQFHLARVFRRQTGFTLHGYRDQLRLRFCLDQLIAGAATVSDLSYSVGYSSPSHFSDSFRRTFGFPPSRTAEVMLHHDVRALKRGS